MIYTKMFAILKKILFFIAHCRIFVGALPTTVSAPAIIFCPLLCGQLNCGFAGLMTYRLQEKPSDKTADIRTAAIWQKIKSADLQTVFSGKNTATDYLNGRETLQAMDMAILELKREEAQEFLFFQTDRASDLFHVAQEMTAFLSR